MELAEWVKSAALERLLPLELYRILVSRPELDTYQTRLTRVKSQMEHARGSAQMLVLAGGGGRGKDSGGDVLMGALAGNPAAPSDESIVWSLQA